VIVVSAQLNPSIHPSPFLFAHSFLFSDAVVDQYRENACEKILERFQRDLGALVDSQALERRTTLTQMKQNGSSNTQLQASRYIQNKHLFLLIIQSSEWNHRNSYFCLFSPSICS